MIDLPRRLIQYKRKTGELAVVAFLGVQLALPVPVFALRNQNSDSASVLTGLEETLKATNPAATTSEISVSRINSPTPTKSNLPTYLPTWSPRVRSWLRKERVGIIWNSLGLFGSIRSRGSSSSP